MLTANTKLSFKPVFVGWTTLLLQLPFQLFMSVWAGGFFGVMIAQLAHSWPAAPSLLIGGTVFVVMPFVVYTVKKLNYGRAEYRFYPDRIEFEQGFFTVSKKVVMFHDVKEVTLRKGFFQRFSGLGTVYLSTVATGFISTVNLFDLLGATSVSAAGIAIKDIANPDEAYDAIKNLIDGRSD